MLEIREIFKTIQKYYGLFMDNDTNSGCSSHSECNEESQSLCNGSGYFANTQYDEIKPVIVSESETIQPIVNQKQLQGNKYAPTSKSKISVLPQGVDMVSNFLAPCGRGQGEGLKAAFTLAEVLITLGIIGVVAALTLPTLIQNHQKQVYVTQLKKAYSTISNAFNKMAADEGVVDWNQTYCKSNIDYSSVEIQECFKHLTKQLSVLNFKEPGEPCNADWCKTSAFREWGDSSEYMINEGVFFTTSDGILYIFACGTINYLIVDINGATKGPNLRGRDIFEFYIDTYDKNKIEPAGLPNSWKNCSATNLSTNCTAKVLIEGKMNY